MYGYCLECGEKGGGRMHHLRRDLHVACYERVLKEAKAEGEKDVL